MSKKKPKMLLENISLVSNNDSIELANAMVRMERSYRNILQLKKRLSNYSYEPRTYTLYKQLDDLKLRLELLGVSHLKLMNALKKPIHFIEVQVLQVKENIEAVRIVEQSVSEYINQAK